ncbi:DinB family protein [Mucilaginibacter roseus]|uniref:DinB family protein n=1 Tax=Mucilaginibacter roseus TaxID=1528868 RepID=A0ABS8U363_9SPHI|nr:DinB family protein [Mucilaginibacter roseus]MCD8739958.1 DinB family protein [Mucilaginibacter roseus]
MNDVDFAKASIHELDAEYTASLKCLERIPETLFEYRPHEKSMALGYLALLVAEIPLWVYHIASGNDIDFATYTHFQPKTTGELVDHFKSNQQKAIEVLKGIQDGDLVGTFSLKNNGTVLHSEPRRDSISSSINHMVHHRGQLTVYMRLNNIPVPSIYGPSADDRTFG